MGKESRRLSRVLFSILLCGMFLNPWVLLVWPLSGVSFLLVSKAKAVESDVFPELVYWSAVRSGDLEKIVRYLETDFSPDEPDSSGITPLMYAVKLDHGEMLSLLLEYGAKIDQEDSYGNTAAILAASLGKTQILRQLIEAGADIDYQNKEGASLLIQAVKAEQTSSARLLLTAGSDPGLVDHTGRDAQYYAEIARSRSIRRLFTDQAR